MPRLDVIGVIVSNIETAIDFYGRLGLRFPEDPDPEGHGHVETTLPGGLRFTLDTEESIRSFDPDWSPPAGGHRMAVAFRCDSPTEVDHLYQELVPARRGSRPSAMPFPLALPLHRTQLLLEHGAARLTSGGDPYDQPGTPGGGDDASLLSQVETLRFKVVAKHGKGMAKSKKRHQGR